MTHKTLEERIEAVKAGDMSFVFHATPKDTCQHEWKGWREFDDGRGGETVCAKCGMGAMSHSLRYGI